MDTKTDTESGNSPQSISEFDQLKMELEQDFFNELAKDEDKCDKLQDQEGDDEEAEADEDDDEYASMESSKDDDLDSTKAQDQEKIFKDESDVKNKSSKHSIIKSRMQSKSIEGKKANKLLMQNMEKLWMAAPPPSASSERTSVARNEKCSSFMVTIKLFDRGLVVNDFSDETSLYTLCRAWMKNQKTSLVSSQYFFALMSAASTRQNNGYEILQQLKRGEKNLICSMPANPTTSKAATELENSQNENSPQKRMPNLIALENALKTNHDSPCLGEDNITSKEILLAQHKLRWKKTKSDWIRNIRKNYKKYENNFEIIETLFKPHFKISSCLFESEQAN